MVSHCEFCLRWETEASITLIGCEIYEITGHKAGSNRKTSLIIKDKRESFTLQQSLKPWTARRKSSPNKQPWCHESLDVQRGEYYKISYISLHFKTKHTP